MNIVCRKTKCKYNNNQACTSPRLLIDRELNCEQYEPIEKDSLQDVSKNMMEVAPEIAPFKHNKDIEIRCRANCVFNDDGECKANGIFVNGQTPKLNEKVADMVKDDEAVDDEAEQNSRKKSSENGLCGKGKVNENADLKAGKKKKGDKSSKSGLFGFFKKNKKVGQERLLNSSNQSFGSEKILERNCSCVDGESFSSKGNGKSANDAGDLRKCCGYADNESCGNECGGKKASDLDNRELEMRCVNNKNDFDCFADSECKGNGKGDCRCDSEKMGENKAKCGCESGQAKCFTFANR